MKSLFGSTGKFAAISIGVALGYYLAARVGLQFAIPPGYATAVWAPSGLALAAVLFLGYRVWPGIWLGAFLANLWVAASPTVAVIAGTGNTAEALIGAWLLRRYVPPRPFARVQDAFVLLGIAAVAAVCAASVGVGGLSLVGCLPEPLFSPNWLTWWLGDLAGQVIFAPVLLALAGRRWTPARERHSREVATWVILQIVLGLLLFGGWLPETQAERLLYLPMLLLIWAGVRFHLVEVAAGAVLFAVAAVWGTSLGKGAYGTEFLHQALFDLQVLLNTYAVTGLALAGIVAKRRDTEVALHQVNTQLRHEIAERHRAEDWFRQLLESSPDALVISNGGGEIVLVNESAERQLGYARAELIGQPIEVLVPESLRDRHQEQRREYGQSPRIRMMGTGHALEVRRRDGTIFPADIALGPMRTEEGLFVFAAIRDITEQRRTQELMIHQRAQLVAAAEIQKYLLPQSAPELPGYEFGGQCYPAEFAGGDYFDYLQLADGTWVVIVADVSGHGIAPAILMAWLDAYLRLLAETHTDLVEMLTRTNRALVQQTPQNRFVTLMAAHLDPRSRTLRYINAGHPEGWVISREGRLKHRLESHTVPLAIQSETRFPLSESLELAAGDLVVFVTDGILEAAAPGQPAFGSDNSLRTLVALRERSAAEVVERLHATACQHAGAPTLTDDATVVVVKVRE